MHPAPSVILFTTLSGAGFGLLFWLGLGLPAVTGMIAFVFFALAYVLAVGGLLASTFHLANRRNARFAFSQWRTSWLSREGVVSVAALVVMALFGAGLVFADAGWSLVGVVGSALSLLCVFTTSMIYAKLKAVPRWHSRLTPALFLTLALAGGALLAGQVAAALVLLPIAGTVQILLWYRGDRALAGSGTDLGTATGLGRIGKTRAFEPPHTGGNYLLSEFAYVVGRRHSTRLRVIALLLMAVLPMILLLLPAGHVAAALAALSHLIGVLASRWLFFAEAEHVVGLYYGKRAA
jgi:DMSO reductase anchor subunit